MNASVIVGLLELALYWLGLYWAMTASFLAPLYAFISRDDG